MAASPFRFSIDDATPKTARSRVGLAGVTSGAASGGEGYRQSALRPGSAGWMAATFGGEPRTAYGPPAAPVTPPPPVLTPPLPPPAAPVVPDDYNTNPLRGFNAGEGDGAG